MRAGRRLPGLTRWNRGQALVEFAMVLPLLLAVGFIITEFGRALWEKNVLQQAAREGCRAAVVTSPSNAVAAAVARCNQFLDENGMGPSYGNPAVPVAEVFDDGGRWMVRVTVSRVFSFIPGDVPTEPFGGGLISSEGLNAGQILITARATMQGEGGGSASP